MELMNAELHHSIEYNEILEVRSMTALSWILLRVFRYIQNESLLHVEIFHWKFQLPIMIE